MKEISKNGRKLPPFLEQMRLPLVAAPMFLVTGPELVIAACRAGIMGVIASGSARSPSEYDEWLQMFRQELGPLSEMGEQSVGPWAANLSVGKGGHSDSSRLSANLESCRATMPPVVVTVSGSPAEIVQEVHTWGGIVVHDVTTIAHAKKAAAVGVDGLVLVCGGGGGHSGMLNPFVFVEAVRRFFDGIIILAGAIGTGRGIAAARLMGADLAYVGTPFIATRESRAPHEYKEMIVSAGSKDLIYTPTFSRGIPAMMLRQSIANAGYDPDDLPPAPADGSYLPGAKPWKEVWAAGQSVEVIDGIRSVAEVVDIYEKQYWAAIRNEP